MKPVFAGLIHRSMAALADLVVLFLAMVPLFPGMSPLLPAAVRGTLIGAVILVWYVVVPTTRLSGTPGQRIGGIKVTDMHGARIGIGRSLLRFAFLLVTLATAGLGFIAAGWSRKRQALHDLVARTVVVDAKASPEEIEGGVAFVWWVNQVLSVFGLVLVLTVFYVPVSVYRQMHDRTRLAIAMNAAHAYQGEVEAALRESRPVPAPAAKLPADVRAIYARADGTVVLETADAFLSAGRVIHTPTRTQKGIEWRCTAENIPRYLLPAPCRP